MSEYHGEMSNETTPLAGEPAAGRPEPRRRRWPWVVAALASAAVLARGRRPRAASASGSLRAAERAGAAVISWGVAGSEVGVAGTFYFTAGTEAGDMHLYWSTERTHNDTADDDGGAATMRLHTVADASKTVEYCAVDGEIVFFTDRHGIKFVLVDSHKVHALLELDEGAYPRRRRARARVVGDI